MQAPVGYDIYGYGYRDKTGDKVHQGRPVPYGEKFGAGDVIGVYITLASGNGSLFNFGKRRERLLCTYRGQLYFEVKEHIELEPKISNGSTIGFSKNGVYQGIAFEDIFEGPYYASLSLYRGARISMNFGPVFKYPPYDAKFRPYSERYFDTAVENMLYDVVDSIEMDILRRKT